MPDNGKRSRFRVEWLWTFFPAFLGLGIVVILAELDIIELNFSIHDVDTFIILFGLLVTIVVSSIIISRESLRQMKALTEVQLHEEYAEERARFLRRLDHEIKNPLMGIQTALDNLGETTDPEHRGQIRAAMTAQIDRLSSLITDLRKIGEFDQRQLEHLPIDSLALIQDAYSIACEDERAARREMCLEVPEHLPAIRGDYDLLLLAVYNVLNNALKYTREGDRVQLSAAANDERFVIAVTDSGPGISAEDLTQVWDELYRSQMAKHIPGSGIGLALVRRIIERHGGEVAIRSELEQGTTVDLVLPVPVEDPM